MSKRDRAREYEKKNAGTNQETQPNGEPGAVPEPNAEAAANYLSQLSRAATEFQKLVMDANGEVTPALELFLVRIQAELPQTVDSLQFIMEHQTAISVVLMKRAEELGRTAQLCSDMVQKIEANIKAAIRSREITEVKGALCGFRIKPAEEILLFDETRISNVYFSDVVQNKLDVDRLKIRVKECQGLRQKLPDGVTIEKGFTLESFQIVSV